LGAGDWSSSKPVFRSISLRGSPIRGRRVRTWKKIRSFVAFFVHFLQKPERRQYRGDLPGGIPSGPVWTVVDFKTDASVDDQQQYAAQLRHRGSVMVAARVLESLPSFPVSEILLRTLIQARVIAMHETRRR